MFRNVVLYTDGNANIKVMKNKSNDSVDGVVALAMAMGMYLQQNKYEFNYNNK
jgi:phage terminase large subunit-like protein